MKRLLSRLLRGSKSKSDSYPRSMQDLRGGDPCWCGSGKSYRRCHRPEDRRREKELGLGPGKNPGCDAFT